MDKKNSGDTRRVTWIDKEEYRVWKVEFHDRKDSHLKTLTMGGYEKHNKKFWRAGDMQMVNHQTGKGTLIKFADYKFNAGLKASDFSQNSLKRAR